MNDVLKTREMTFLDASRSKDCVDDILVYLTREGFEPEPHYVKITGLGDRWFVGTLLEEPNAEFGCHVGDVIPFFAQQLEDGSVICFANMTPEPKFDAEAFSDGKMLDEAIMVFNQRHNEESLVELLQILRDTPLVVPCKEIISEDEINPQLLLRQDKYYFPVFSNEEALGDNAEGMPTVKRSILEVIELAGKEEQKVESIIVNPFTEAFAFIPDFWEMMKELDSRIE